jgi:hypothetical protein
MIMEPQGHPAPVTMNAKTEHCSLWSKLLKASLIVAAAISSSVAVAAPDLTPEDTAQLNPSGSSAETKSESRRVVTVAMEPVALQREPGSPPSLMEETSVKNATQDELLLLDMPQHVSPTAFDAGSYALSSLGANASVCRSVAG